MKGPLQLDPKGLYPLEAFARPLGAQFPVFTSPQCWEDVVRYDPVGVLQSMFNAIAKALLNDRADRPTIEFRAWIPPQGKQRKAKRVRLQASLYQMIESNQVWIELKTSSLPSRRGRSSA